MQPIAALRALASASVGAAWLAAALVSAVACESERRSEVRTLDAHYGGCAEVRRGPVCVLPKDGDVTVWLPGDGAGTETETGVTSPASVSSDLRVAVDGRPVAFQFSRIESGTRVVVAARDLHGLLDDGALQDSPAPLARLAPLAPPATLLFSRHGAAFALNIRAHRTLPKELAVAVEHKRRKRYADARDVLTALLASGHGDTLPEALSLLARVERALGNHRVAESRYRRAIAAHRRAGNLSAVVDDTTALVFVLIQHGRRFAESRRLLDGLAAGTTQGLARHSDSNYLVAYYRGMLGRKIADHRSALAYSRQASREAMRLGDVRRRGYSDEILGHSLAETGRVHEALALVDRALEELPEAGSECARMVLVNNYAWQLLLEKDASTQAGDLSRGAGRENPNRPRALFHEALQLASGPCADYPGKRATIHLNLALAALHDGDLDGVERNLANALRSSEDGGEAKDAREGRMGTALDSLWARDIQGRLAIARGEHERALGHYEAMFELASDFSSPPGRWRALVGLAQSHDVLGRHKRAQALWKRAESLLDTDSLLVPIHARRDRFLGRRAVATRRQIESLLASGELTEALRVARHARSRFLRSLVNDRRMQSLSAADRATWDLAMEDYRRHRDELEVASANAWQLPSDALAAARRQQWHLEQLTREALDHALALLGNQVAVLGDASLPDGSLLLAVFPLEDDWVVFAQDAQGLRVQRVPKFDVAKATPAELSAQLLAPFERELTRNARVVVMPSGATRGIDFHALPFRGQPLLATHRVAYSLDLAPSRSGGVSQVSQRREGANETLIVADPRGDLPHARKEGVRAYALVAGPVRLVSGREATATTLRALIPTARTFHFAGHGDFAESDGFGSALSLADNTRLTVADVLALPHAPERVVLVGCETAKSATDVALESMGLAQAFLVSGSDVVAASVRTINDSLGERFTELLYEGQLAAFESAAQDAQRALYRNHPESDWASFRVIIP